MNCKQDYITAVACIGGAVAAYQISKYVCSRKENKDDLSEWVPVGRVKSLYIFPMKSGKAKPTFSLYCDKLGAKSGENHDRLFLVTDKNGHFFTGRNKPQLLLVDVDVRDDILHLRYGDDSITVDLPSVRNANKVIPATLFQNQRQDGLDCGEEAANFFRRVIGEDALLVMFAPNLYTERTVTTDGDWWNNHQVPKRTEDSRYTDLTPFMITTQTSVDALNERLAKKLPAVQFRGNIVIEGCPAWDEDRWYDLRFGETETTNTVEMQCVKPCDRCLMTTIDPVTGMKDETQQPLVTLREFRMPTGRMLSSMGPHPLFGVNCVISKPGFVHVGQTLWARYKKSAF